MAELQDIINSGAVRQPGGPTLPLSLNPGTFYVLDTVDGPQLYVGSATSVPVNVTSLIREIAGFQANVNGFYAGNLLIESVSVDAESYVQRVFSDEGEISDLEDVYNWFEGTTITQRVGNIRSAFAVNSIESFALYGQTGLGQLAGRLIRWRYKDVNAPTTGFDLEVAPTTLKMANPQTVTSLPATMSPRSSLIRLTITAPGTLTLQPATGSGQIVVIKDASGNVNTHNVTIDGDGSDTIDGASTLVMNTNRQKVWLRDQAPGIWEVL